jgi:hypothetical protein
MKRKHPGGWLARIGLAGFLFFLIKGMAWLLVLAALVMWDGCSTPSAG